MSSTAKPPRTSFNETKNLLKNNMVNKYLHYQIYIYIYKNAIQSQFL